MSVTALHNGDKQGINQQIFLYG